MKKSLLTPHEKAELIRLIDKLPVATMCQDCKGFEGGYCAKAEAMIPQDVLESGCELWEFNSDSPPF